MPKKLTSEYISKQLSSRGFTLIGDYINSTTSVEVECLNGHRYPTRVMNIIHRGDGCPTCSGHSSKSIYTTDYVNKLIGARGIRLEDEFSTVNTKTKFVCDKNHHWVTQAGLVIHGSGCPECYGNTKWELNDVNHELSSKGIEMISDYHGVTKNATYRCGLGHEWSVAPRGIIQKNGTGCPSCAGYGFNRSKRAWLYVIKFQEFIKYGITNDLDGRLAKHTRSNGQHEIVHTKLFEDGGRAAAIEKIIKTIYGGNFVDKTICPDGFTETLNPLTQSELIETLGRIYENS